MTCAISEEQLFSWIDRQAPDLEEHLANCPECRAKAGEISATIGQVSQAVAAPAQRLPDQIGEYLINRLIGTGGQGWVFEAQQPSPRRRVALKVVKGGCMIDERDVRRIRREADTLALLKHPGIASVYQAGSTEDGQPFFAMELVEGETILQYARKHDLSTRQRLELFLKVCEALEYAHQQGVIHRDLKPSNILVERGDLPKILDFGLARITDSNGHATATIVEAGKILGTLQYMSPEHARGDTGAIGVASDVYSLCVILYELLTGKPPYEINARMPHQGLRAICEQPPVPPGRILRKIRGDVETILLKGLEKDPARRYQSVAELADDIRRHLNRQPITARRPSYAYRVRKLISRNKASFALTGVIVALSTGFGAWITAMYAEARVTQERVTAPTTDPEAGLNRAELAKIKWQEAGQSKTDDQRLRALARSEEHCRKALDLFRGNMPDESKTVLDTRILLGRILTRLDKRREAEPILRRALQTYAANYPGQSGLIAEAKNALGECLIKPGSYQQAEFLLAESYPLIRSYRGPGHPRTIEARQALATLYTAWGKPDKAREYGAPAAPTTRPAAPKPIMPKTVLPPGPLYNNEKPDRP